MVPGPRRQPALTPRSCGTRPSRRRAVPARPRAGPVHAALGRRVLPELCERARSGRFADMRELHFATAGDDAAGSAAFLAQEEAADPVASRANTWPCSSRASGPCSTRSPSALPSSAASAAPVAPALRYVISVDAAFVGDRFAMVLGHREFRGLELDVIRAGEGPGARRSSSTRPSTRSPPCRGPTTGPRSLSTSTPPSPSGRRSASGA